MTQLKRESKNFEAFQEGILLAFLNTQGYSFALKRPERVAEKTYQYLTINELYYKEQPLQFGSKIADFCEKQFELDMDPSLTHSQFKIVKRRKDLNRTALSFSWLIKYAEHHGAVFTKRKTKAAKKTVQLEKITGMTIPKKNCEFDRDQIEMIGRDVQEYIATLFDKNEKELIIPAYHQYFNYILDGKNDQLRQKGMKNNERNEYGKLVGNESKKKKKNAKEEVIGEEIQIQQENQDDHSTPMTEMNYYVNQYNPNDYQQINTMNMMNYQTQFQPIQQPIQTQFIPIDQYNQMNLITQFNQLLELYQGNQLSLFNQLQYCQNQLMNSPEIQNAFTLSNFNNINTYYPNTMNTSFNTQPTINNSYNSNCSYSDQSRSDKCIQIVKEEMTENNVYEYN